MDIKLLEIAGKQAGIYFIVTDNSAVPTSISTSNLRLVPINSQKGPVNTVIIFNSGDTTSFENVFGKSTRQMERRGNQSLKTALKCLESGPVAVINLRLFDDELDKTQIRAFSANSKNGETKLVPYTGLFNTNQLWTVTPKNMTNLFNQDNLLNIGNVGTSDISVFITVSTHVDEVTSQGDEKLSTTDLEIEEYPALNPEMLLKDTFVDVWVFDNTFNIDSVSTNKYYGQFFDNDGNVDLSRLYELSQIAEAGFNRRFTGSLIPNLVSENGESISIDTVINQAYSETGLVAYINDEVLESDDLNTIDFDGSTFYDEEGNRLSDAAENLLSHIAPSQIHKTFVPFPPTSDIVKTIEDQEVIFETERVELSDGSFDENSFIGVFEQGVRVGDRIKGINGTIVEVTGIEILETNVPAPDPEGPKQKFAVTLKSSLNGSYTVTANGTQVVSGYEYEENSVMVIKVSPNENYKLGKIIINGSQLPDGVTSFNLSSETVVEVQFSEITYKVLIQEPENGTITVTSSKGEINNNDDVQKGTSLTITPTPNEGYSIGEVKVNDIVISEPYTGIVRENTNISVTFVPKKYIVYLTDTENGTVELTDSEGNSITPNTGVSFNSIVVIKPVPSEHYELDQIIVDGEPLDEGISQFVVPAKDVAIIVTFKKKLYKVEFSESLGGTFIVKNGDSQLTSGNTVDALTTITVETTPDENMQVSSITVNDSPIEGNTFEIIADSIVKVTFEKIMHTITKVAPENGEFSVEQNDGTPVISGSKIAQGTELYVKVTPAAHYKLKQVLVNDVKLEAVEDEYKFTVDEPKTVKVEFEPIVWNVTVESETSQVDVEIQTLAGEPVSDLTNVMDGTTLKVVATPKTGYHITQIMAGESDITLIKTFNVTSDVTVKVTTEIDKHRISWTDPDNGTISVTANEEPVVNGSEVDYGTVLNIELSVNTGYHKVSLTANGEEVVGEVTVNSDVVIAAETAIDTFVVTFEQPENATLSVKIGEEEVVSGNSYPYNSVLDIVATPSEHYDVVGITVNSEPQVELSTTQFTLTEEVTGITVETAIKQYTINYEQPENATLSVSKVKGSSLVPSGTKVDALTELVVTLTPNEGYEKISLKANDVDVEGGKITATTNTTIVGVVSIKTFTVNFVQPLNGSIVVTKTDGDEPVVSGQSIDYGTELKVVVSANEYYSLTSFTDNDADKLENASNYVLTVKENHTFAALTAKVMYALSFNQPENGTLVVTVNSEPHTSGEEVWAGDTVVATATPNENYQLKSLKYNSQDVSSGAGFKITEATTVEAIFEPIMRTVTKNPATGGSYEVKKGLDYAENVEDTVMQGTSIKIVPSAEQYYQLKAVKVNGSPIESPYVYIVAGDNVTIDVEFEKIQYTVTYVSDAGNGNSISVKNADATVESGTKVDAGTTLTVEVVTAENYENTQLHAGDSDILSSKSFVLENDTEITYEFVRPEFTVKYNAPTSGTLTVTKKDDGSTVNNGDKVYKGEILNLNATVSDDENFVKFVINTSSAEISENPGEYKVIENVDSINLVTEKKQSTVTLENTLGGDYTVTMYDWTNETEGSEISSGSKVNYGTKIKIKIVDSSQSEITPENVTIKVTKDGGEPEDYVYGTSVLTVENQLINISVGPKA